MDYVVNDAWRAARDRKLYKMLDPDQPAWLVSEQVMPQTDEVLFDVVHHWGPDGWTRRRYLYDTVGNVMHFRGTSPIDDAELVKMKPEHRIPHHRFLQQR
ncbi:MAG TPA: hypothetical protein VF707_10220 [Ardenticatenaceae bacterium]|jgi:hypothetical protein